MASASVVSQLCALAVFPIVARWCTVGDLGLYQLYLSVVTGISVIACLRYDYALLQPASESEARSLSTVAIVAALVSGLATVGAVIVAGGLFQTEGWIRLRDSVAFVAIAVSVGGITSVRTQWLTRRGAFGQLVRARLAQSTIMAGTQILTSFYGYGGFGLLLSDVLGRCAGLIALWRPDNCQGPGQTRLRELLHVALRYSRFPMISTPSAIINAVGFSLPVLFLERYYGVSGVGIYSLLERIMGVPTTFAGQPLSQTFIHRLRESMREPSRNGARNELSSTVRATAVLGIVPFAALALAGPRIVSVVFGEQWQTVGHLAQVLAVPYFVAYAFWPVMPALIILNRLWAQIAWDSSRVLALLTVACCAHFGSFSIEEIIALIATVMSAFSIAHFLLCARSTARP